MPRSDPANCAISPIGHNGGPPLDEMMSMTVKTAMRITDFSKDTLYDLLAAGEIKSFLMGSRRYIWAASLRAYIARRAAEPLTIRRSPKPRSGKGGRALGRGGEDLIQRGGSPSGNIRLFLEEGNNDPTRTT
jgi:excisionase family DNA binding protein